ncbi:MAG: YihY family inner membrane protein [Gammaproteobacteria bacterium]|nr:YihY family inner membrane protein [Gammaproteobacteria bacterium]
MFERVTRIYETLKQFAAMVVRRYLEDNCQSTAAALTYQTLFAVVPLLTVIYAMFNAFSAFEGLSVRLQSIIFQNVVPENVDVVQQYLTEFSQQAQSLSVPSLVVLAVTAFLLLYTIERTFNDIWRIREPRGGYQRFLMYWALLTLGPILIGVGFVISTYLVSLPLVSDVTRTTGTLQFLPLIMSTAVFTLIYLTVPNCPVPFRHAVFGGLLVACVFELAKYAFANVMARSDLEVIYGTFAAVPLFLLWIYISWTIVLMGAEVVKGLSVFHYHGDARIESPFIQLLLILELFYLAHERGEVVRERDVRKLSDRIEVSEWNDLKALLVELGLIKSVDGGGIVLTRDLNEVSVWELYKQVPFDMPRTMNGDKPWEHALNDKLKHISDRNEEYLKLSLESLFRSTRPETDAARKEETRSVV